MRLLYSTLIYSLLCITPTSTTAFTTTLYTPSAAAKLRQKAALLRASTTTTSSSLQEDATAIDVQPIPSLLYDNDNDDNSATKYSKQQQEQQSKKQTKQSLFQLNQSTGHLILPNGNVLLDRMNPSQWKAEIFDNNDNDNDNSNIDSMMLHANSFASDTELSIGQLWNVKNILSVSRLTKYWMGPAFDSIPYDTQFLLVELENTDDTDEQQPPQYALVLPLVDNGFRAALQTSDENDDDSKINLEIICSAENGDERSDVTNMRALYVAVGSDPFQLLREGFQQVASQLQTFRPLSQKALPDTVNYFGWCTWDAFYSKVDPKGIIAGVQSLRNAGVPPRTLILDDGWQQVSPQAPEQVIVDANVSIIDTVSQFLMATIVIPFVGAFYERFVKRAAHGSIPNVIWKTVSHSILKGGIWTFFNQETDFVRQLSGFAANSKFEGSSSSLKDLVATLKTEMGLTKVYCWHALHGYWRGVSNELGDDIGGKVWQVAPKTSEHLLKVQPELSWDPVSLFGVGLLTTQKDISKFYERLHAPLVEAGVDGVKIDVQSGVTAIGADIGASGPPIAAMYNQAMEQSVTEHFTSPDTGAIDCINCMCHSTENLYRYDATSVARASEDFFPDRSDSQTVHIVNVAYNSLFLGEICLPDWDMFHSKHEYAPLHAAARAVGGCPIYVSDKPGRHDADLLRKLVMPDGSILRGNLPGRPTRDCLFADVGTDGVSALKIWNQNSVGGVVGAFHVQGVEWNFDTHENHVVDEFPDRLTATVRPSDVESLRGKDGPFCAWRHRAGTLELLQDADSELTVDLNHREWEIFTMVPVQTTGDVLWGPVGLADMMNSGGGLLHADEPLEQTTTKDKSTTTTGLSARGPGRFVAYCQPAPTRVLIDGKESVKELEFLHDDLTGQLTFQLPEEQDGAHHRLTVVWDETLLLD